MFEQATRQKLRISSSFGNLSVEDLWDLPLTKLNDIAKVLKRTLKDSEEDDFLEERSIKGTEDQLRFDIVLHVLNTKKAENKARLDAKEKKEQKNRLLEILARKQDAALENLSEEELLKKLESL